MTNLIVARVIGLAAACILALSLTAQTAASVWDGAYTAGQAANGAASYRTNCASCHGADLQGVGQAPPLAGSDFMMSWNGMTAGDLFDKMQTSMPADKPGQLSRQENANILAFIFQANKFPAGQSDLSTDATVLAKIRIEAKAGK